MKTFQWICRVRTMAMLTVVVLVTGCGKEDIRAYQVPKEKPRRAQAAPPATDSTPQRIIAAMVTRADTSWFFKLTGSDALVAAEKPNFIQFLSKVEFRDGTHEAGAADGGGKPHLHWTMIPQAWKEVAGSEMRFATFEITNPNGQIADLGVIPLPVIEGKELDFVNMWRGQIQLPPADQAGLDRMREVVTIGGLAGQLFDLKGDTESDPVSTPATAVAQSPGKLPQWSVPGGWQATTASQLLLASFDLPGGKAKITVSSFPGDAGGLLANINRWRGQLSLPDVSQAELGGMTSEIDVAAGKATLVELSNATQRMLVVVVPHEGQSWFYKSFGDAAAVEAAKDPFLQFAKSAQY